MSGACPSAGRTLFVLSPGKVGTQWSNSSKSCYKVQEMNKLLELTLI
jgi:hypothetical protein